jgi:class 3 adenylate cyclase/tetratricopeptide (TPR) repeat protein
VPTCTSCGRDSADEFAFCPHCGAPFAAAEPAREQRKVVTVLFCDVTGSTELGEKLDPEALRALLARYFERMKTIVERHGGSVEKFIGDAVMAVFGVPAVHEDDALRAVRAAVEMLDAFPALGVRGRIGVTTGEVVTGTEERLATGDAVNVAARLQQAAQPNEILIGAETLGLTRDAVEVEAMDPLTLKGKAEAVPVFRLLSASGEEGFARHLDAPMIGREREQRMLAEAWERVVSERFCHLFTVLGPAGVGKSRLAAEFLSSLGASLIVRGRCLPYGEGITYWPVVEVVMQLPEAELEPAAAEAIQAVVGEGSTLSSSEEIAWAFRKLLEAVAAERPVVCMFDDIHWGEETFLDLIEHVADLSRDAPILMLCMARPDLLDRRPGWAGGKVNATNVLLEPLGADETDRLIESLAPLDEGLHERIREAAEGNPLFVEEMVSMARESSDGEIVVPPTIQALLAARLDQLDVPERSVLERGAIEGRIFHRGAVQALAPDEPEVAARLISLVRKELVRPDKGQLPGEDAFRFRHLLIRDAAYDSLPKATRAQLHERFAEWLESHGAGLIELDEILGYHYEQAARYRAELGSPDQDLSRRAGERLGAAARRAGQRGDLNAEINLLERALPLRSDSRQDLPLELSLVSSLFWSGRLVDAERRLGEIAARVAESGDAEAILLVRIVRLQNAMSTDPDATVAELRTLADEAIPVFEAGGNEYGLMRAWSVIGTVEHSLCRFEAQLEALRRAAEHAARAGDERQAEQLTYMMSSGFLFGPAPAEEGLHWIISWLAQRSTRPAGLLSMMAMLEAMQGRFGEARALLVEGADRSRELGQRLWAALSGEAWYHVEMRAGDLDAAERELRRSCELLEEMGERGWLSTHAGLLGRVLCTLGRHEEAEEWARKSRELGWSDDVITQMLWRQVLALVRARGESFEEAELLAREAIAYGERTDMLSARGLAHLDLAEVLALSAHGEDAVEEVRTALALFEQKGDRPLATEAQARLERLL